MANKNGRFRMNELRPLTKAERRRHARARRRNWGIAAVAVLLLSRAVVRLLPDWASQVLGPVVWLGMILVAILLYASYLRDVRQQ